MFLVSVVCTADAIEVTLVWTEVKQFLVKQNYHHSSKSLHKSCSLVCSVPSASGVFFQILVPLAYL
jgi:hypothetical protein